MQWDVVRFGNFFVGFSMTAAAAAINLHASNQPQPSGKCFVDFPRIERFDQTNYAMVSVPLKPPPIRMKRAPRFPWPMQFTMRKENAPLQFCTDF